MKPVLDETRADWRLEGNRALYRKMNVENMEKSTYCIGSTCFNSARIERNRVNEVVDETTRSRGVMPGALDAEGMRNGLCAVV